MRSDEELIRAVADGDRTALRELHDEHAAWISSRLRRRCSDRDAVAEAVQDTFVAASPTDEALVTTAEEHVLAGIEYGDLAGALLRLSPELRAVLQATVLDGLSTREAATLLGVPQGTVKTRMMRARTELRGALT